MTRRTPRAVRDVLASADRLWVTYRMDDWLLERLDFHPSMRLSLPGTVVAITARRFASFSPLVARRRRATVLPLSTTKEPS